MNVVDPLGNPPQLKGRKVGVEFGETYHACVSLRTCGGEPNFSILEVESTEDLCLTPQSGERLFFKKSL